MKNCVQVLNPLGHSFLAHLNSKILLDKFGKNKAGFRPPTQQLETACTAK